MLDDQTWLLVAFSLSGLLLYSKLQFMVIMSAEIGTDTKRVKRSSVAAMVCFRLLVALVPYVLSKEVKLEPASCPVLSDGDWARCFQIYADVSPRSALQRHGKLRSEEVLPS